MSIKMYKDKSFKRVRGFQVKAHLKDGWTYEPSKTKSTPKKKPKYKLEIKEVDVIKPDLEGPEDLTNEE